MSDHKAVLFSVVLFQLPISHNAPVCCHIFNSMCASRFSELFAVAPLTAFDPHFNTEMLVSLFSQTYQTVVDSVAHIQRQNVK